MTLEYLIVSIITAIVVANVIHHKFSSPKFRLIDTVFICCAGGFVGTFIFSLLEWQYIGAILGSAAGSVALFFRMKKFK